MRLLQSVLPGLSQAKQPQRKLLTHLLGLLLMLPGHATFRNLSRYSSYDEKTSSRWYAKAFDFVSLNKAAITHVTPPEHEQTNVYWATKDIQMRNTRRTHWITYHGETGCMKDWATILGISHFTLADRLKRWTGERAFTLPIHANTPRHA